MTNTGDLTNGLATANMGGTGNARELTRLTKPATKSNKVQSAKARYKCQDHDKHSVLKSLVPIKFKIIFVLKMVKFLFKYLLLHVLL